MAWLMKCLSGRELYWDWTRLGALVETIGLSGILKRKGENGAKDERGVRELVLRGMSSWGTGGGKRRRRRARNGEELGGWWCGGGRRGMGRHQPRGERVRSLS